MAVGAVLGIGVEGIGIEAVLGIGVEAVLRVEPVAG